MAAEGSAKERGNLQLRSERLELEPFSFQDTPFLHALWTDPSVRRYLWDDRAITAEEAAAVIAASRLSFQLHGFGMWVLRLKPDLVPIGFCGLRHFGEPPVDVEVLYALLPSHWHLGLATEAASTVLGFAFTTGLPRVFAGADPPNAASIRVMRRLGMTFHSNRVLNGLEATYFAIDAPSQGGGPGRNRG
jgi:[ribosomal protein S5]-alanine N-acetyltransferase